MHFPGAWLSRIRLPLLVKKVESSEVGSVEVESIEVESIAPAFRYGVGQGQGPILNLTQACANQFNTASKGL
jgi:hypothetical protein